MKIRISTARLHEKGYALMLVLFFAGIGVLILSGAMDWTATNARNNDRNNRYFATVAAAEGATEIALASMSQDFFIFGEGEVYDNMNAQRYDTNVPVVAHDGYWGNYSFSTPVNMTNNVIDGMNRIYRTSLSKTTNAPGTDYAGWYKTSGRYQIIAHARENNALGLPITAAVGQEISFDMIPATQAAIYYDNMDLEINPGPNMTVTGKVHSNRNIYTQPQANLTFLDYVTAVGNIVADKSPLDPSIRTPGTINYSSPPTSGVPPMQIPGVNTTNSAHRILEYPEPGEDRNSVAGKERYYNKADMVVVVTDNGIIVTNGPNRPSFNPLPQNEARVFVNTNASFWNEREGLQVQATEIDVAKLGEWARTNTVNMIGDNVNILFVDDQRSTTRNIPITNRYYTTNYTTNFTMTTTATYPAAGTYRPPVITNCNTANITNTTLPGIPPRCPNFTPFMSGTRFVYRTIAGYSYERINVIVNVMTNTVITTNNMEVAQSGVRLANGELLPNGGLTVATPDPVYIWGDYNVTDGSGFSRSVGDTANTRPSSVVADAINILSEAWLDSRSTNAVGSRNAANTTVNAAFLSGIVPSDGVHYSGGVENFPRFLETWGSSRIFTYNGSMIVLFPSEVATAPWGSPNVYSPPRRDWAFDMNFNDINKLPPGCPNFQSYSRARWATLKPGQTSF